ncbi:MAG: DUF1653 domain-containing protein [Rubrivivax sp.]|jgi:hypothetical protein
MASSNDSDLPPLPSSPPGRYRHYKGGLYEVLGTVRDSETLEPRVLYRPLHGNGDAWVRPHAMFFEHVTVDGQTVPRFARLPDDPTVESPSGQTLPRPKP